MTTRQSARDIPHKNRNVYLPPAPTRRRFLTATSSVVAAMAVPDTAQAAMLPGTGLTASGFRRALNSQFRATALSSARSNSLALTLTQVTSPRHAHPSLDASRAGEMVFSLTFDVGPESHSKLVQDTFALSHPVLGDFAALLVPTGNGRSLHAEFHRL